MKRRFLDFVGLRPALPLAEEFFGLMHEHPGLVLPEAETHYFSSEKITKGSNWYEERFPKCAASCKRGEFSTSYLSTPGAAARLSREYPDAQVFALICDPLEAVATMYERATVGKVVEGGLEAYLEQHPLVLEQFKFGKQLAAYFGYYSPVDLMVITFDDVRANPATVLQKVYAHLEVDATFLPKVFRVLVEEEEVRPGWWARKLRIDRLRARRRAARLAKAQSVFGPATFTLTAKERILLARYYEDDVKQLSALLQRDCIAEWGYPIERHHKK